MKKRRKFAVIQGQKKDKGNKGQKFALAIAGVAVAVLLAQALFTLGHNFVAARLIQTVVTDQGYLETVLPVRGAIVREERLVASPATGTLTWLADEGEKVAAGKDIARISTPGGQAAIISAPVPGLLSIQLDGLEGTLVPHGLSSVTPDFLEELAANTRRTESGATVSQGSLICKVVENFVWYFLVSVPADDVRELDGAGTCRVRFPFSRGEAVTGRMAYWGEEGDRVLLALEFDVDLDTFLNERFIDADIVIKRTSGIILPASALENQEDETGIYTLEKGTVRFRPVEVLAEAGGEVAVTGVPPGLSVITNPAWVREGQRL